MAATVFLTRAGAAGAQGMRTALSLAATTGRALRLAGLAGDGRGRGGLEPGSFTALAAAAAICGGSFRLGHDGDEAEFLPQGPPRPGDYAFDVARERKSADSLGLTAECLALPLALAPGESRVILRGGSHVPGGPTSDELAQIVAPAWRSLGLPIAFSEIAPGFLPQGGGEVELSTPGGGGLRPLKADDPFLPRLVGVEVVSAGLPVHLAEQALQGALDRLALHGHKAKGRIRRARAQAGLSLLAWAAGDQLKVGFTALGRRGGRPEAAAVSACEALLAFLDSRAALPAHLATALLPALALAPGLSRLTVDTMTRGLKAALETVDAFFPGALAVSQPRDAAILEIRLVGQRFAAQPAAGQPAAPRS